MPRKIMPSSQAEITGCIFAAVVVILVIAVLIFLDYLTAIASLLFSAGLAGIVVGLRRWMNDKGSRVFWASVVWSVLTIVLLLWLRMPAPAH